MPSVGRLHHEGQAAAQVGLADGGLEFDERRDRLRVGSPTASDSHSGAQAVSEMLGCRKPPDRSRCDVPRPPLSTAWSRTSRTLKPNVDEQFGSAGSSAIVTVAVCRFAVAIVCEWNAGAGVQTGGQDF